MPYLSGSFDAIIIGLSKSMDKLIVPTEIVEILSLIGLLKECERTRVLKF